MGNIHWPDDGAGGDDDHPASPPDLDNSQRGAGLQPKDLRDLWADVSTHGLELPVLMFYGHHSGQYRAFSNFFTHEPFDFRLPARCGADALGATGRALTVSCTFAEKAIMVCKAATMRDYASFDAIARAHTPGEAKKLGRRVGPWDQRAWDRVVCQVAEEVVFQKFAALPHLAEVLDATGDRTLAEMTRNDAHWGTGLDPSHVNASRPPKWRGTNILGWALICARARLRAAASSSRTEAH